MLTTLTDRAAATTLAGYLLPTLRNRHQQPVTAVQARDALAHLCQTAYKTDMAGPTGDDVRAAWDLAAPEPAEVARPVLAAPIADGALVCPHCGRRGTICEIDSCVRENLLHVDGPDHIGVEEADISFATDRFECRECGGHVTLPVEPTWS